MKQVDIKTRVIPNKPRSGNYPVGSTIVAGGGSGGSTTIVNQGGADLATLRQLFLSKKTDDTASGIITFLKGIKIASSLIRSLLKKDDKGEITDEAIMSALRIIKEIEDNNEYLKTIFLRKDQNDSTEYFLSLLGGAQIGKNLTFGEFITNVSGGMIDEKGIAELESLFLRSELIVPAIRYNFMTYFMGYNIISPGGGLKVKDFTDKGDGTWTVVPDLDEGIPCGQYVDDILTGFWYDKNADSGDFAGFRKMQFRVMSVDYDAKTFVMAPRPDTESVPYKELKLGQTGNFTNENRQTYIVIDTRDGSNCITLFEHANTWDPEPAQMPAWFGKKKGMTVQGINADNYSAVLQNIIMTGLIYQIDEITGDTVRVPLWKGEWKAGKYGYYNEVSHNGSRYICVNPKGTEQEPGTGVDWMVTVKKGEDGAPGLSVVGGGHWEASKTPYAANTMVTLANCVFLSNVETSNPPIRISRFKSGNYRRMKNGGYILAGKSVDWEVHSDWTMLLDGRELKGTSITFLGSFASAPANPKEGNSYYNTTDKCTYVYQNGVWMLMVSDGKDGRDYEWIYTRNNSIGIIPDKPDSKQQDDYVPEGWTDDFLGVSEEYQVEWGCKRTKRDGIWSDWSTPAVVHRWSKDGENAVIADLDNEMVNCALTSDGKASKEQSWVTNVSIWYGYESLSLTSISTTQPSGIKVSANKGTGAVTVSVAEGTTLSDTNDVIIKLSANKNGQIFERNLIFTIAGIRAGQDGQDAVLYSLLPSTSSIVKYKDGSHNVSTISCKRQKTVGGKISDIKDGTLKYCIDGGEEITISDNEGISTSNINKTIKFLFYVNNILVDVETIPKLSDGKDGENAVIADLDNEMVSCALTSDGKVSKAQSWTTHVTIWYGYERLKLTSITTSQPSGLTVHSDNSTGTVTVTASEGTSLAEINDVVITLSAEKDGQNFERKLTFSVAGVRDGSDGIGVSSITNYYLAISQSSGVTTSTSGWSTTIQSVSDSKKYLWNYEKITYTNGQSVNTSPAIIGMYSSDGKGISSVTEEYGLSTSQSTQPITWQSTLPTMSASNKYLWNRETINYSDNTTKTNVHIIAVYGDKGDDAILYSLVTSVSSVTKYKDGSLSVSSVSCKRQKTVGGVISDTTDGTLKYSIDGGSELNINNNQGVSSDSFTRYLKFSYYVNNRLVDVETIPKLSDGKDGEHGADGTSMNPRGNWVSSGIPYQKNDLVNFAYGSFVALRQTSNPPFPISRFKNGSYRRKKDGGYILAGNGTTLNEDWQVVTPPTYPGSYWLDCPVSSIGISSVGTPSPSSVLVTCKMNIRNSVQLCSDFYLVARKYNASWIAHVSPVKSFELSVPATAGYTQFAVRAYRSSSDANSWNDNYVCEKGIGVVTDGKNGNDGKDSAFPYDNGPWQSGNTYVWNDTRRDKVIHPFNGVYYNFLVKNKGASVTVAPSSANGDSNWEAMNKLINIATDSLFADGANVANFLFKNGVLRSQDETDGVANIIMNGKTGYFHCSNADITGTINAKSGTFAGKLVGATGTFTGSLLTNSSGKRILINPDTRSIQLILPDNNVISEWAFFELNGYSSCTLKLFNNGGENLILYPHIMQIRRGSNVQLNAEPDALTLVNGSNSISIRANQITMSDGNNYTGYTGTAEYVPPNGYSKTLYFKNGILYKIG